MINWVDITGDVEQKILEIQHDRYTDTITQRQMYYTSVHAFTQMHASITCDCEYTYISTKL